jgi:DNA-binding transcriptional LysR family regulator
MQLRHLKTFVAVATTLNFTRAAEQVHLAQSSVSEQIQALEADLGTPLFDRSRRELKLTYAGHRLFDYAEKLLAFAEEARSAVAEAGQTVAGRLTVGGLETICATRLPALIADFCSQYPEVDVSVRSANSAALRNAVKTGDMDVCFILGSSAGEPNLQSAQVAREALVTIVPPDHPLAGGKPVGPDDLKRTPFLVTEPGCVYRRLFEQAFPAKGGSRPRIAGELGSIAAIHGLVEAGVGCALVPYIAAADAIEAGRVIALPWAGDYTSVPITMLWRESDVQHPALALFIALAQHDLDAVTPAADRRRREALSL